MKLRETGRKVANFGPWAGELFAETHRGQTPRDVRRREARAKHENAAKMARKVANFGKDGQK